MNSPNEIIVLELIKNVVHISSVMTVDKIEGVIPHKLLLVVSLCLSKGIK
jgi:hypothetical protein